MKGGSNWYCITMACIQPGKMREAGSSPSCQRLSMSQSAHQAIASNTLTAPTKNSSRCGASASRLGESGKAWRSVMRHSISQGGAVRLDRSQQDAPLQNVTRSFAHRLRPVSWMRTGSAG